MPYSVSEAYGDVRNRHQAVIEYPIMSMDPVAERVYGSNNDRVQRFQDLQDLRGRTWVTWTTG